MDHDLHLRLALRRRGRRASSTTVFEVRPAARAEQPAPGRIGRRSWSRIARAGLQLPSSFFVHRGRRTSAGLINPEHGRRVPARSAAFFGMGSERGVRDRPAHRQVLGHGSNRPARAHRPCGGAAGPAGDPRVRRQLVDRLGERLPLAQPLPTGELGLCASGPAAAPRRRAGAGRVVRGGGRCRTGRREHPALRARRRPLVIRAQMHRPDTVGVQLHTIDRHSGQAIEDRRTVAHARGPSC